MRKRLHNHRFGERPHRPASLLGGLALLCLVSGLVGCDESEDILADYEGARPLQFLAVTQSHTPDIQWVGGRVAAVGVNRGEEAALDETLVWLYSAGGNEISSHVTLGENTNVPAIEAAGGSAIDSLDNGEVYTFWIAEKSAFDAALAPGARDGLNFADTTLTAALELAGRQRGRLDVEMRIIRDQRLLGERFILDWQPRDFPVRRIAIRRGSGSAGFSDLVWHILLEDEAPDALLPPIEIGTLPGGAVQAVAWPDGGFVEDTYTVWMVDSEWNGSFGINPTGMAYMIVFSSNF